MQYPQLPKTCPDCGHAFSTVLRPKSKFNKRGVALLVVAAVISVAWAAALAYAIWISPVIVIPLGKVAQFIALLVLVAPGFGIGILAMQHRCVVLKCRQCRWSEVYQMKKLKPAREEGGV